MWHHFSTACLWMHTSSNLTPCSFIITGRQSGKSAHLSTVTNHEAAASHCMLKRGTWLISSEKSSLLLKKYASSATWKHKHRSPAMRTCPTEAASVYEWSMKPFIGCPVYLLGQWQEVRWKQRRWQTYENNNKKRGEQLLPPHECFSCWKICCFNRRFHQLLRKRKLKPPQNPTKKWSPVLTRSLNEQPEEEEEEEKGERDTVGGGGGGNGIPEMRYTVSREKHGPSFQAEPLVVGRRESGW